MDAGIPYRIYDPGGTGAGLMKGVSSEPPPPSPTSYEQLVAENNVLKERMKGLKSLGNLLEESQSEATKLKQKVEELVRQEVLRSTITLLPQEAQSPAASSGAEGSAQACPQLPSCGSDQSGKPAEAKAEEKPASSGSSSEFEVVNSIDKNETPAEAHQDVLQQLANEDGNLSVHLQRLESSLSMFAEETNKKHLLAHLGRMAVEFNRLSSKVQKNEYKTAILQTLCKQLQTENEDLRRKLDRDLDLKNQMLAKMKCENLKLKEMIVEKKEMQQGARYEVSRPGPAELLVQGAESQQSVKVGEHQQQRPDKNSVEILEKKVAALEVQRKELLDVNKQWDQQFRGMKHQYEQKIVNLRQRLALAQKELTERETACDEKQRDFDRKLLLAKSKLDNGETEKERFLTEIKGLKQENQCLRDQLLPLTKQRECQEKEIQRLNKALEEALSLQSPTPQAPLFTAAGDSCMNTRRNELLTQIEVLKQQVKIFEEDFLRERSDRERMSEEKEELRQKLEKVQTEMMMLNTQGLGERRASDPPPGAQRIYCPTYQLPYPPLAHPGTVYGPYDLQIRYPPSAMPPGHPHYQPPDYPWNVAYTPSRSQHTAEPDRPKSDGKEPASPGQGKGQH
ncbi:TNFAIP3-interacting protein 1 isoform X2 [Pristis pectinata]|uniref:TNFAIP3-interacting protein 1 isoform X2 n=1 Tax=Pristis pectinata TaxID=685728 RepID=UPI00223E1A52|nr:TNFAIP3-interacting protein 1 isoform X2 [Pristis pectinata]